MHCLFSKSNSVTNPKKYAILYNIKLFTERGVFVATQCYTEYATKKKALPKKCLLELMLQQAYKDISVTDICREADIPRRTFYHYFESKDDVLDSMIEELLQQCFLNTTYGLHIGSEQMKANFARVFRFWEGNNRIKLDALIRNGLESRLITGSAQFIRAERTGLLRKSGLDPKQVEIGLMVGITDFFTLLFYWSREGYRETPEQMAEYAAWVLPHAFYQV